MKKEKLWSVPFLLVLAINILNGVASFMTNPLMPDYLVTHGALFEVTGLISSLLSWIALLFRPFSGALSDTFSKKRVMFAAYLASALCMLAYSMVRAVPWIIAVRIVHGIAFALSGTISMAFATNFIPKSRMAEGINYIGIASLVGQMVGPQIGTTIADLTDINLAFLIAAIGYAVCLFIIPMVPYHFEKAAVNGQRHFQIRDFFAYELLVYVILIGMFSFGNGILSYYLTSFGEARHIANIAWFFTVYSLAMLVMKPFVGKLQDRRGISIILYPSFIVYTAGIVLLANAYTLLPVLVAAVFKAIGQGNGAPAIQAEAVRTLGVEKSGVAFSTCLIGQDLGNAMGPIFASFAISSMGYTSMFYLYAGMLLCGLGLFHIYKKKEAKRT